MKAKNCDECRYSKIDELNNFICLKRHKPRLYQPKTLSDAHSGNWGFKRKCEDFKEL